MNNPRLRHLKKSKNGAKTPKTPLAASNLAQAEATLFARLREAYGPDWVLPSGAIDPKKIIEGSLAPMTMAYWCHVACKAAHRGHQRRITSYLSVAYATACRFRDDDKSVALLADVVTDGRTKRIPVEKIKEGILHYTFIYISSKVD